MFFIIYSLLILFTTFIVRYLVFYNVHDQQNIICDMINVYTKYILKLNITCKGVTIDDYKKNIMVISNHPCYMDWFTLPSFHRTYFPNHDYIIVAKKIQRDYLLLENI